MIVRAAEPRRQDLDVAGTRPRPAATIPARSPNPTDAGQRVPDAARLHDGLERVGQVRGHRARLRLQHDDHACRSPRTATARRSPGRRTNTSSRRARRSRSTIRRPRSTRRKATLTHRVHLGRHAGESFPRPGWTYNAARHGDQPVAGRELRRQRHLRVLVHRQGSDA